jgi:hypothetical protein
MRSVSTAAALTPLLLLGCPDDPSGLSRVDGQVQLEPRQVDLQDVPVGVTASASFTLRNIGGQRFDLREVRVAGDVIFVPGNGEPGTLAPGAERVVTVSARPDAATPYGARLVFDTSLGQVSAEIRLNGVAPPDCDDGNVCTEDRFDPETNRCVTEFSDGVACQSADLCIIDSVCAQGVCIGRSKVCDDDSPCTQDYCRQSDGACVFDLDEDACDDGNPCTADGCGVDGCFHEPLLAGTECDDGDPCSTADACFAGQCTGAALADGLPCDDGDSCTVNTACDGGQCVGENIVDLAQEGEVVFEVGLRNWEPNAFLHRREVSLTDEGILVGLDHLSLPNGGLNHEIFAYEQCGSEAFTYRYQPRGTNSVVRYVRRALQVTPAGEIDVIVGVRQLPDNGFEPQTTRFRLGSDGEELEAPTGPSPGGETGWSLTPDGSLLFGVILPTAGVGGLAQDTFSMIRLDRDGVRLWQNDRATSDWAEFLGVAGPRVLFWSAGRFGALDFATGALVWSRQTEFIPKEMALSTTLNLGVARAGDQLIAVELLDGEELFRFPDPFDPSYVARTDPVIASDGRILLMMERRDELTGLPSTLEWVELDARGQVQSATPLPYRFPPRAEDARHEDFFDDPYPTVADDGVTYVGYGDRFWAIDPGGGIRWTLTDVVNGFSGTVPLLRDDGILWISRGSRSVVGVKTNGGRMDTQAWSSFRNDARRTNYTP